MPLPNPFSRKPVAPIQRTIVTFLLDRTGSMNSILSSTISAFNAYTGGLKKAPNTTFTLLQFDSDRGLDVTYKNIPASVIQPLGRGSYVPGGGTNLIDSCVDTIRAVEKVVQPGDKVVVCFQTDGEENASRRHTWDELNRLIAEKRELGWEFNFMGAGIDAYQQASKMGLGAAQTMSYDSEDWVSTQTAFASRGMATAMYASGGRSDMSYTAAEKLAAGDKYDPERKKKPGMIDLSSGVTPALPAPEGASDDGR